MFLSNKDFIETSITKYLDEMIISFGHRSIMLELQPLVPYLLSNTLIQMTGFLEKKLDLILWEFGCYDFNIRYDITRQQRCLSSQYSSVSDIYKYFKKLKITNTNLLDHYDLADNAFYRIIKIFENTKIKDYAGQDFIAFLSLKKESEDFKKSVIDSNEKSELILKKLYEDTIAYRNRIAHNISSIQPEMPSINCLKNRNIIYDNYFTRYMILTYFDLVFTNLYKQYIETKIPIKL